MRKLGLEMGWEDCWAAQEIYGEEGDCWLGAE
jgi:hypothetical protein